MTTGCGHDGRTRERFTATNLCNPGRELTRAMYLGIGMTAAIYVLVSIDTFPALSPDEVERYGDTALAHAAWSSTTDGIPAASQHTSA